MFNRPSVLSAAFVILLSASAQVQAEQPASGFGVFGGVTSHSMHPSGATPDYSSSGLSMGIDYQFGLADSFSLNPFLMSAGERVSGGITDTSAGHGILGIEGRYWLDSEYFLGMHIGSYTEVLQANSNNVSTNASGGGYGLTAGWENSAKDGKFDGIFIALQLDQAKIRYNDADVDLRGLRLHIGYRWK